MRMAKLSTNPWGCEAPCPNRQERKREKKSPGPQMRTRFRANRRTPCSAWRQKPGLEWINGKLPWLIWEEATDPDYRSSWPGLLDSSERLGLGDIDKASLAERAELPALHTTLSSRRLRSGCLGLDDPVQRSREATVETRKGEPLILSLSLIPGVGHETTGGKLGREVKMV
jgi:hypothetical protein